MINMANYTYTCKTSDQIHFQRERMKVEEGEDLRLCLSLSALEAQRPSTSAGETRHIVHRRGKGSHGEEEGMGKKKLRLSKQQAVVLEEAFQQRHTLAPKVKAALAAELDMRPRQVEVWFQNRRARNKLKKTEVDCEMLKRFCEDLSAENQRLHRELLELQALENPEPPPPFTTLLRICPSCEKAGAIEDRVSAYHVHGIVARPPFHCQRIFPMS